MNKFEVDENIIMYSFRYCLGRKTSAVSEMADYLFDNWDKLRPFTQNQMQEEIKYAIKRGYAGMDCDVIEWKKILDLKVKK